MKPLHIKATDDSPEIVLNREESRFEISGKSLPEDVSSFFKPVMTWLEDYQKNPLDETHVSVRLSYFNTASSKLLLDIFLILEEIREAGKNVEINWYYPYYDEEMKDAGEEYSEMVDLKFNIILEK